MSDQPKIQRVLRLLIMLSGTRYYTVEELADRLEVSERTVYRYLDTLRQAGFVFNDYDHRIILERNHPNKRLFDLLMFSEEEATILYQAIDSIDAENELKSELVKKLYALYNSKRIVDLTIKPQRGKIINILSQGIAQKRQVVLRDYSSPSSDSCKDRIIEPIAFGYDYLFIWAFEPVQGKCRIFRISRARSAELLDRFFEHEDKHKPLFTDPFRMSSDGYLARVEVLLSRRAYHLLIEEYPLTEKYVSEIKENQWKLSCEVCTFDGIGRFLLGLIDEVEILSPPSLIQFLKEKIKRSSLSLKK